MPYGLPDQGGATAQQSINFSAGSTSNNLSAVTFADSNGVTFGLNAGTITASVNTSAAQQSINFSAGTTSNNASNIIFSNSNNVSFGLNGSTITASATVASTAGSVNFSAGTTSGNLESVVFSNSNGVSFGLNGSTITASAAAAAGGTISEFMPFQGNITGAANAFGQGTLGIYPLSLPEFLTADRAIFLLGLSISTSSNSSHAGTLSLNVGIYTKNASSLSLLTSGSVAYQWTNTSNNSMASLNGQQRIASVPLNLSLTPGQYFVGTISRTSSAGANWFTASNWYFQGATAQISGLFMEASANSVQYPLGAKAYTATTAAMPNSIAFSQLTGIFIPATQNFGFVNGTVP